MKKLILAGFLAIASIPAFAGSHSDVQYFADGSIIREHALIPAAAGTAAAFIGNAASTTSVASAGAATLVFDYLDDGRVGPWKVILGAAGAAIAPGWTFLGVILGNSLDEYASY